MQFCAVANAAAGLRFYDSPADAAWTTDTCASCTAIPHASTTYAHLVDVLVVYDHAWLPGSNCFVRCPSSTWNATAPTTFMPFYAFDRLILRRHCWQDIYLPGRRWRCTGRQRTPLPPVWLFLRILPHVYLSCDLAPQLQFVAVAFFLPDVTRARARALPLPCPDYRFFAHATPWILHAGNI